MNGKPKTLADVDEIDVFVNIITARQILNARRRTEARKTAKMMEHWNRRIRQEQWMRIMIRFLAAVLLMEIGGVIVLILSNGLCP